MSDHMKQGRGIEPETTPFDDTPFECIETVSGLSDDDKRAAIDQARKIYRTTKNRGEIQGEEKVIEAISLPNDYTGQELYYATQVGPLAYTSGDLAWPAAISVDLAETVEPGSEAFHEAAAKLNIGSRNFKYKSHFVTRGYRTLIEYAEETGRPMHPLQLEQEVNVRLSAKERERAVRHLGELPGIDPPHNTVAWKYTPAQEAEISDSYEQDSKSGNAETAG